MMWPTVYTFVPPQVVICLDDRRHLKNRRARRRSHYGKQTVDEKLKGRLSPKQQRELGI